MTVKEEVRAQSVSQDCSHGGEAREGETASCLLPWPQGSDPDPRSFSCHPFVMTLIRPFSKPIIAGFWVFFLNQVMGELYWDLGTSGLLICCVALGESLYFSGLCAFFL